MDSSTQSTVRPFGRKPAWLRVRAPGGEAYERTRRIVAARGLRTVCQSAGCPNIGECWSAGTATIMILGDCCTRACGFCGVPRGEPGALDPGEPLRVARAVKAMGVGHAVITSVTRDDLPDGGATAWAETLRVIRREAPAASIEALVPDFLGRSENWQRVFAAGPDILAHNVETVPRLYSAVRPGADYRRSLELLRSAAEATAAAKSGLMVGLGETADEITKVLADLRSVGVDIVTIGQYLRPSRGRLPVARYVRPAGFDALADQARRMGFRAVACGPLVRSSYRAAQLARAVGVGG